MKLLRDVQAGQVLRSRDDLAKLFPRTIPRVADSLNLGKCKLAGKKLEFSYIRTDPIGADVDLFFRCCKFACPGLLMIGKKLFDFMACEVEQDRIAVAYGDDVSTKYEWFRYVTKEICKEKLPGVGADYRLFTIFSEPVKQCVYHIDQSEEF